MSDSPLAVARTHVLSLVRSTTLAISGEAHRDAQGYHVVRTFVMCAGSELNFAGFVRFIAGLGGVWF